MGRSYFKSTGSDNKILEIILPHSSITIAILDHNHPKRACRWHRAMVMFSTVTQAILEVKFLVDVAKEVVDNAKEDVVGDARWE